MILAVVLAAGAGSRFDGPEHKLRVPLDGVAVVRHAVDAAVSAGIGPVVVVTGAVDLDDLLPDGVQVVANPDWATGQASSVRTAVGAAERAGAEAVVVGLGDMPAVAPEAWRAVASAPGDLVSASYDGTRSPPVKVGRSLWPELPATGDEGARSLMRRHPEWVTVVEVPGPALDIDRPSDLPT